jgi:hypothetical protein
MPVFFTQGFADAHATASFSDYITIFGGSGTGTLSVNYSSACSFEGSPCPITYVLPPGTFTFGQPFLVSASVSAWGDSVNGAGGQDIDEQAFFSLNSLTINGDPQYTYSSASGAIYPFTDANYIPEPATWITGIAALLTGCARRKCKTHPASHSHRAQIQ